LLSAVGEPDTHSARGESAASGYVHRRRQELALSSFDFVQDQQDYYCYRVSNLAVSRSTLTMSKAKSLLPRIADRALRSGQSEDSSCHLGDLCAPEVSRHTQSFLYSEPTRLHCSRRVLFVAKLRFELSYNLSAAVGVCADRDATALPDRHYVVVSGVRFLTGAATRFDCAVAVDASYNHYAYQHSL